MTKLPTFKGTPEIFLFRFFKGAFQSINEDHTEKGAESWLSRQFSGIEFEESALLPLMENLLKDQSISLYFNRERALKLPTLHLDFSSDSRGTTQGLGYEETDTSLQRAFNFTCEAVVTAKNELELVCFSNLIRSIVYVFYAELEFNGWRNASVAERALMLPRDIAPEDIYARSISIMGEYDYPMARFLKQGTMNTKLLFTCNIKR